MLKQILLAVVGSLVVHGAVLLPHLRPHDPVAHSFTEGDKGHGLRFSVRPMQNQIVNVPNEELSATGKGTQKRPDQSVPLAQTLAKSLPTAISGFKSSEIFYTVSEVDQPAIPYADWLVPWDVLREAKLREFVVQLWILNTGEVVYADVLETTPPEAVSSISESLSSWILRTRTYPALKDGKPVASRRTIEVTLEL